ncbi:MAG: YihY/virulence factor BrkB family protein [Deltaproteobacteria bacterium]|nr:YihY/virulence factor BrkB family protein [Deltaproteobacteria bacterium]
MATLVNIEKKFIGGGTQFAKKLMNTAIAAFSDYKGRHLGNQAASVSFYAIFSVFPLLAFTVYLVGQLIGDEGHARSAPMVLRMLREFVPAMQSWIEKGLFDVIKGNAVTSWMNAVLLGWSGLGLFKALLAAIEALPEDHHHEHRAHTTQLALALSTLGLFAVFIATIVFCEMAGKTDKIPFWLQTLPLEAQDVLYFGAHSRALLGLVSIGIVMLLYKLLLPVKVSIKSSLVGSLVFTGLLLASRSVYWIYLHYNTHAIQSSYGIFSTLILIMLWVHFCVSCLMFGCLFALHLDELDKGAGHGHGAGPVSGHDGHSGSVDEHKQAA